MGRESVERHAPRNVPFLTTREAFVLKAAASEGLRREWVAGAGDERRRRAPLAGPVAALPLPRPEALTPEVTANDVEWFFSANELGELLAATHHLAPFRINPGSVQAEHWRSVAFKGGAEPGVLNMSAFLIATDGTPHCIVATWNDGQALEAERLGAPFRALLRLVADTAR